MRPGPRSLILELLSTLRGHAAPVRALVEAAAVFGISGNSLRVALARLLSEGLLERDERGRYRLAAGAAALSEQIHGWRRLEAGLRPWSGDWIGTSLGALPRKTGRRRRLRERALRLLGFRELEPGLQIRPDNLAGGAAAVRERLLALGLEAQARVFRLSDLDDEGERRARGLWDVAELQRSYRLTRERLETSAARLSSLPRSLAMAESFELGGSAIRQLALDPRLPEPLLPAGERRALAEALHRYDRLGREVWAGWLGEPGPDLARLPADVGADDRRLLARA